MFVGLFALLGLEVLIGDWCCLLMGFIVDCGLLFGWVELLADFICWVFSVFVCDV